uniref:Uncharacterized protein n=1 Tax=Cyprinodon variegatus TaxID=28743 RepID=A0A3Q2GHX3_CYPVA
MPPDSSAQSAKKTGSSTKFTKMEVDIFSPAAIESLCYICHNAADCLEYRGFGWPNLQKNKKKNNDPKNNDPIC